jgi:hypothetical protein
MLDAHSPHFGIQSIGVKDEVKNMRPSSWFAINAVVLLVLGMTARAQSLLNKHVAVTGNSIAQFQGGFQRREFPLLPPQNVVIRGENSYTCSMVLTLIPYLVPANTDVVVLIDSTNDIQRGVTVDEHMACIAQTIAVLLARNPNLRLVVANTPPWTHWDPCTNSYRDDSVVSEITAFNAAYADQVTGLQALWPSNVRVADVWTPNADQDGWAIPQYMTGPCGIHPGNSGVWSSAWQHFSDAYTGLVMAAVNRRW